MLSPTANWGMEIIGKNTLAIKHRRRHILLPDIFGFVQYLGGRWTVPWLTSKQVILEFSVSSDTLQYMLKHLQMFSKTDLGHP